MFEIEISEFVHNYVLRNYSEKLDSPLLRSDQAVFESQIIGIKHSLDSVFETLKTNPFSYPKFDSEIYLACHSYLPFLLFYKITGKSVVVFGCKKREELF